MTETPHLRIALRTVTDDGGTWWVAFLTKPEAMEAALEMGRIRRSAVEIPAVKEAFMQAMELTVDGLLRDRGISAKRWERHDVGRNG